MSCVAVQNLGGKNIDATRLFELIFDKIGLKAPISKDYRQVVEKVVDIISHPADYKKNYQATVVPLETGGGKSSITNFTLAWLAENDFLNCGTIILKEKIIDCDATVKDINEIVGAQVAVAFHSKAYEDVTTKGKYLKESILRDILFKFPILVMTHEGFKRRQKKLGDFIYWTDDKTATKMDHANRRLVRTRLIVDEQPTLMDAYQITNEKLSIFEQQLQKSGNRKLLVEASVICQHIRENCFLRRLDLEEQYWYSCDLSFSNEFDIAMMNYRNEKVRDIYSALKIFCEEGGFVNYSDYENYKYISVARYIDIFDPLFNTIILDGTGRINSVYKNKFFNIVDMPQIKNYSNTTICVCKQLSGARKELTTNTGIIDTAIEFILNKVPHDEKCLIITHKGSEKQFVDASLPPNIHVDHYGNITGTNEYRDIQYGFYIGMPFMYDDAYKLAFHIYNKDKNYDKTHKVITIKGVRKMVDKDYNDTKVSILSVELIQAINRLRCRNWHNGNTPETFVFMFNRDEEVLNQIKEGMPGVKIISDDQFYDMLPPEVKEKKPEYAIDKFLKLINRLKSEHSGLVTTKGNLLGLDECLNMMSHVTKSRLWKSPEIQQLIEDKIILIKGRTIKIL